MFDQEQLLPAIVPTKPERLHLQHPFHNGINHELLLQYLKQRLDFASQTRDLLIPRYTAIDKDVAGFLNLSDDDRKRRIEELQGKGPKVTTVHLPLVMLQLDDALTYFMNVFAPESGMYQAVAKRAEQEVANSFSALMNSHALDRGYFRELLKFLFDCLKYNLGGVQTFWDTELGNQITTDINSGNTKIETGVLWQGNEFKSLDMYNTLWDPSTHPIDAHHKGEFVATIEMLTQYKLRRLIQDGIVANADDFLGNTSDTLMTSWYREPPELFDSRSTDMSHEGTNTVNWVKILSQDGFNRLGSGVVRLPPSADVAQVSEAHLVQRRRTGRT